jgi:hypothetical protein
VLNVPKLPQQSHLQAAASNPSMHAPNKELTLLGLVILRFLFTLEKTKTLKEEFIKCLQKSSKMTFPCYENCKKNSACVRRL